MKIEGLVNITYYDTTTGKVLEERTIHNTNTNMGKWLLMEKINSVGVDGTALPTGVADAAERYRITHFTVGTGAGATDVTLNSLQKIVPIKDAVDDTDANKYVLFQDGVDADGADDGTYDEFTDFITTDVIDANVDTTTEDYKSLPYLKVLDAIEYKDPDSISYKLKIEQDEVVAGDTTDFTLAEFGLYAMPYTADDETVLDEALPKILFARLTDTYTKSSTVGIVLEWIVKIT